MTLFLLGYGDYPYFLIADEDAVRAGERYLEKIGLSKDLIDLVSVHGSFPIEEPLNTSQLWPLFTNNPPSWCKWNV
jgi:hypothetical protein